MAQFSTKLKEDINDKKMSQSLIIIKEQLIDKKWIILVLGAMIGGMSLLIVAIIGQMDIEAMMAGYPPELLGLFGADFSNPYGFLSMEVITVIWMFVGIYMIFSASLIIPQEIEEKTIELFLSKPITRKKFLGSKIVSTYMIITGIMVIGFLMTSGVIPLSPDFVEEGLYFDRLWGTCLVTILFVGVMAMFSLFCSTIFLHSKKAMVLGIVVVFAMFFINGFYSFLEELEFLQWFTIFRYYNSADYLINPELDVYIRDIIVLASLNAVFLIGSLVVFNLKDIPN